MFNVFHAFGCAPRGRRGGFGPWGLDPGAFGDLWGSGGRGGGGRGRVFEHGDLKFVILQLLREKPRHGYEIIKELEERVGGAYSPSPGTIYPTLSLLEDLGHASASAEEGGRKVYEITDQGRRYLDENRATVDDIFERMKGHGSGATGHPGVEFGQALRDLTQATLRSAASTGWNPARLRKLTEVLRRALREVEAQGE